MTIIMLTKSLAYLTSIAVGSFGIDMLAVTTLLKLSPSHAVDLVYTTNERPKWLWELASPINLVEYYETDKIMSPCVH